MNADSTPLLSVILPTADTFGSIRQTVRALRAQTIRDRIELVIVTPIANPGVIPAEVSGFAKVTVVNAGPMRTSNASRVAGIREASAPVVALAEDHSFPDPDWAEALVAAHEEGWAVVGPVVRNGSPRSMLSWANHLLEYGPWIEGAKREEVAHLPGHNSAYKRELLLEYGDGLEDIFEVEMVVQQDLTLRGHRMLLEPAARTSHFNFSRLASTLELRFHGGRSFAGHRTRGWSAGKRALYFLCSPLIPVVRFARIIRMLHSSREHAHLLPGIVPMLAVALLADGFGEIAGYVTGPGNSAVAIGAIEFSRWRFMNDDDRKNYLDDAATIIEEPQNQVTHGVGAVMPTHRGP